MDVEGDEGTTREEGKESPRRRCPSCGAASRPGDAFCASCGKRLDQGDGNRVEVGSGTNGTRVIRFGKAAVGAAVAGVVILVLSGLLLLLAVRQLGDGSSYEILHEQDVTYLVGTACMAGNGCGQLGSDLDPGDIGFYEISLDGSVERFEENELGELGGKDLGGYECIAVDYYRDGELVLRAAYGDAGCRGHIEAFETDEYYGPIGENLHLQ